VRAEKRQAVPYSMMRAEWDSGKITKRSTLGRHPFVVMLLRTLCFRLIFRPAPTRRESASDCSRMFIRMISTFFSNTGHVEQENASQGN
jgi:hypothetical protein